MKLYFFPFLLFITAVYTSTQKDVVAELRGSEYNAWIKKYQKDLRVVWFYAPWCKDCKIQYLQFQKAAQRGVDSHFKFAKIDATSMENEAIAQKLNIKTYPVIKYYLPNENIPQQYESQVIADNIISALQGIVNLKQQIKSLADVHTLRSKFPDHPFIIGIFPKETDSLKWFQEIQNQLIDTFKFAILQKGDFQDALKEFNLNNEGIVTIFPDFISNNYTSKENFANKQEMLHWIEENIILKHVIYYPNFQKYLNNNLKRTFGLLVTEASYDKSSKQVKYIWNRLSKMEKNFTIGIADNSLMKEFLEQMGIQENVFLIFLNSQLKFVMEDPVVNKKFIVEKLKLFLYHYEQKNLDVFVKSEKEPDNLYENNVLKIIGKNHRALLQDKEEDFFIMFFSSKDYQVEKQMKIWEQIAEKYKGSDIIIAKYDLSKNDQLPLFKIENTPTFYMLPYRSKRPWRYQQGTSFEEIDQWLQFRISHRKDDL